MHPPKGVFPLVQRLFKNSKGAVTVHHWPSVVSLLLLSWAAVQALELLPLVTRAALLYAEPCLPEALQSIGALLKAKTASSTEAGLWATVLTRPRLV